MQMCRSIFGKYRYLYANELRYLWSYQAKVHKIFTSRRYAKRGIFRRRVSVCHTRVLYEDG